jgi:hypothetical protein
MNQRFLGAWQDQLGWDGISHNTTRNLSQRRKAAKKEFVNIPFILHFI